MFESAIAGCMADGVTAAAPTPVGISAAAPMVAAAAARLRINFRILKFSFARC
jgi:hypothetical protein